MRLDTSAYKSRFIGWPRCCAANATAATPWPAGAGFLNCYCEDWMPQPVPVWKSFPPTTLDRRGGVGVPPDVARKYLGPQNLRYLFVNGCTSASPPRCTAPLGRCRHGS